MAKHLILFLSFLTCLHAEIIETKQMADILPYIDETTWVLFDIDDTLLESEIQAGRSKWFDHEFAKCISKGMNKKEAVESIDAEFFKIADLCPIRTPEPEIVFLLQQVKEMSGAVLGLTARGPHLNQITSKQLDRLNIDLLSHAPTIHHSEFAPACHYEQGILFSIDQKKGPALSRLLEKSGTLPQKIVFIDDKKRHLQEVEEILSDLGISFIGFHYTKTSERPFDLIQAEIEHKTLIEKSSK
jgi:uncharacterized protein DUF2608